MAKEPKLTAASMLDELLDELAERFRKVVRAEIREALSTREAVTGSPAAISEADRAVSTYLEGKSAFSGVPEGVDPALAYFSWALRRWAPTQQRAAIDARIPRMLGTAGDGQSAARAWMSLDVLVREITPLWLTAVGHGAEAVELRRLEAVTDTRSAAAAWRTLRGIRGVDEQAGDTALVAARTVSWARAGAHNGSTAGAFALSASGAAGSASAYAGAALARSRGLDVPSETLEASDRVLLGLLDRMVSLPRLVDEAQS